MEFIIYVIVAGISLSVGMDHSVITYNICNEPTGNIASSKSSKLQKWELIADNCSSYVILLQVKHMNLLVENHSCPRVVEYKAGNQAKYHLMLCHKAKNYCVIENGAKEHDNYSFSDFPERNACLSVESVYPFTIRFPRYNGVKYNLSFQLSYKALDVRSNSATEGSSFEPLDTSTASSNPASMASTSPDISKPAMTNMSSKGNYRILFIIFVTLFGVSVVIIIILISRMVRLTKSKSIEENGIDYYDASSSGHEVVSNTIYSMYKDYKKETNEFSTD